MNISFTVENCEEIFLPTLNNVDEFKRVLRYREKKSNGLNRSLESILGALNDIYRELERLVLFESGPTFDPIPMNSILLDIYKQLTGSCFEQFARLLDFVDRIIRNYIKVIKHAKNVEKMNLELSQKSADLSTAVAFLNRKIRDYIQELNDAEPTKDYARELQFIEDNLNSLNLNRK